MTTTMAGTDRSTTLVRATAVGTGLQVLMVLVGHWVAAVALLFGPLGILISAIAGFLYGRWERPGTVRALGGGAVVGGVCAFLGILLSWILGDVTAAILLFGTMSSAFTGAIGGWLGRRGGAA